MVPSVGFFKPKSGVYDASEYYFTHGFGLARDNIEKTVNSEWRITYYEANNGMDIVAEMTQGRVVGVQYHPEKSGEDGVLIFGRRMKQMGVF